MQNPIACRTLTCILNGERQEVRVILGQPYEDLGTYVCDYEIALGGTLTSNKIAGIDSVQAIQLALFMIGSSLASMEGITAWQWNGDSFTGFPSSLNGPVLGFVP